MSRNINEKFTPSAERPVFCYYTVKLILSSNDSDCTISLMIYDSEGGSNTVQTATHSYLTGLGDIYIQMNALVPAGCEIQIVKSGGGTAVIASEYEAMC